MWGMISRRTLFRRVAGAFVGSLLARTAFLAEEPGLSAGGIVAFVKARQSQAACDWVKGMEAVYWPEPTGEEQSPDCPYGINYWINL